MTARNLVQDLEYFARRVLLSFMERHQTAGASVEVTRKYSDGGLSRVRCKSGDANFGHPTVTVNLPDDLSFESVEGIQAHAERVVEDLGDG